VFSAQCEFGHQWEIKDGTDDLVDLLLFRFLIDVFILQDASNGIPPGPQQLFRVVGILTIGIDGRTHYQ
jgi:hypothetical protein